MEMSDEEEEAPSNKKKKIEYSESMNSQLADSEYIYGCKSPVYRLFKPVSHQ